MRMSDWSSDVCSSDLHVAELRVKGIVRRAQDGDVKGDVGLERIVLAALGGRHTVEPVADPLKLFGLSELCRERGRLGLDRDAPLVEDRKSTRLNSSH